MEPGLPSSAWPRSVVRGGDGGLPFFGHARPVTAQVADAPSSRGTVAPAQTFFGDF